MVDQQSAASSAGWANGCTGSIHGDNVIKNKVARFLALHEPFHQDADRLASKRVSLNHRNAIDEADVSNLNLESRRLVQPCIALAWIFSICAHADSMAPTCQPARALM